jgi:hypothetical protein
MSDETLGRREYKKIQQGRAKQSAFPWCQVSLNITKFKDHRSVTGQGRVVQAAESLCTDGTASIMLVSGSF